MGFFGVLEDHKLPHVPGTVILNEQSAHSEDVTAGLKHGKGRNSHIVLVPQPSEDPNDPLNWPQGKKLAIMVIVGFGSILYASTVGPLLNASLLVLSIDFNKSIGDITLISGYQLLVVGGSGPFVCAAGRKWGKRPMLLLSALLGLLGSVIVSATNSYTGLLAGRIIQGGCTSAFESLVVAMIGDLYFVHERGIYMGWIQFILGCSSNFSSVVCGAVTNHLGWKYLFHFMVLCIGIQIVLMFLFCPETTYIRDPRYDIDELADENLANLAAVEARHERALDPHRDGEKGGAGLEKVSTVDTMSSSRRRTYRKKTFWQSTAIFTGTYSHDPWLKLLLAPFAVCTNLVVLWCVICTGTVVAMYVAQAYVLAQIFSYPPYNLTPEGVGYLSLGPFVGGTLGSLAMGATIDPVIRWASKRNKGIYEPEYRLIPMVGGLLAGTGLVVFGVLCQDLRSYYATATAHGLALFGILCIAVPASSYILDAYREMGNEVFIANMVFKNFVFYSLSYFVNDWTAASGPKVVFGTFGAIAYGFMLTAPLVYVFGKRYRSFWARHNVVEKLGIKTHAEI